MWICYRLDGWMFFLLQCGFFSPVLASSRLKSQLIQDVDEFVSSSDLEKCSITSLAHQWM